MIHGSADKTIPPQVGEKLFAAAHPPKEWLQIEGGGHSNLHVVVRDEYRLKLQQFITRNGLQP